jgi:hypothetical protein
VVSDSMANQPQCSTLQEATKKKTYINMDTTSIRVGSIQADDAIVDHVYLFRHGPLGKTSSGIPML